MDASAGRSAVPRHPVGRAGASPAGPSGGGPPATGGGPATASRPPGGPGPAAGRPRRRVRRTAALAVLLAAILVVGGVAVVRWRAADRAGTAAGEAAEPTPPPVLAALGAGAPEPTPDGVRSAIDGLVTGAALGGRLNVAVLDPVTGQTLYDHGGDLATVPASTTKIITAVTVLASRGPAYRIPTRVVAGATPGEVVLVGGGDPTLAINGTGYYPGAGRLDRLADQVRKALGGATPSKVVLDGSLYSGPVLGPGWDGDVATAGYGAAATALMTDGARVDPKAPPGMTPRVSAPDLAAGRSFAGLFGLPAEAVSQGQAPAAPGGSAAASPGAGSPAPGAELGRVESPPMVRLVDFMLSESDNVVAEALARQVALARNQPASFAGAATAVRAALTDLGLPADQSSLADGSGLSRNNRLSPDLLAQTLALAGSGKRPELTSLVTGLPVAGWSGTLGERFTARSGTAAGAGVVRAKTGTLTGVNAIAGVLTTVDGRLLSFAALADGVTAGSPAAEARLDRIAVTLAGCGCR
ncbi:D-alanyl-D-alanine carboxypeptidase/D-alanyl-D-alanine-endopeptidase [Plantactinospora siamensis]|uniref:D-alanyl-D-alanine carboxypeptidase/D-alanyl-D-alanine-endopeptidase n=1 Tax=Plantactinospora siamensis TaxID=555372 RepID=A0ABV6P525_9ACTN